MRRIRATLAATDYVPSYGGLRLSLQELESMLDALQAGAVQTRLFHDSRRPLHVENVEASIEQRPDGEYALWVKSDADGDRWAEYEAERDAQGGPGGLSFTLLGTFEDLPGRGEPTSASSTTTPLPAGGSPAPVCAPVGGSPQDTISLSTTTTPVGFDQTCYYAHANQALTIRFTNSITAQGDGSPTSLTLVISPINNPAAAAVPGQPGMYESDGSRATFIGTPVVAPNTGVMSVPPLSPGLYVLQTFEMPTNFLATLVVV